MPLSQALIAWADTILCMEENHYAAIMSIMPNVYLEDEVHPPVYILGISDDYDYMQGELINLLETKFDELML